MQKEEQTYHVPVLLNDSIEGMNLQPEGIYVDVTFGGGGHSGAAGCSVTPDMADSALERIIKECGFHD